MCGMCAGGCGTAGHKACGRGDLQVPPTRRNCILRNDQFGLDQKSHNTFLEKEMNWGGAFLKKGKFIHGIGIHGIHGTYEFSLVRNALFPLVWGCSL